MAWEHKNARAGRDPGDKNGKGHRIQQSPQLGAHSIDLWQQGLPLKFQPARLFQSEAEVLGCGGRKDWTPPRGSFLDSR